MQVGVEHHFVRGGAWVLGVAQRLEVVALLLEDEVVHVVLGDVSRQVVLGAGWSVHLGT